MTEELFSRLVSNEVLKGEDACQLLRSLTGPQAWRSWVELALIYIKRGRPDWAGQILEQLLETDSSRSAR